MSMPIAELVPEYIRSFEAYVPSCPDPELMRLYGVNHLHRLNNNENALGPPPAARKVIQDFEAQRSAIYPSGDSFFLRKTLAERFGKDPNRFLVGNGSCEVIASVIKAFCEKGDNIITADKTFAVYEWVAEFSGFQARLIPLRNYGYDPDAMLAAMDRRTKILFVCNPNNPTGTWWDRDTMERFLRQVDGRAIVVVDEAYREYVDDERFPDGMELMERHPNVVVFRTFSKMYALAGLRVGYVCGQREVVEYIRRTHIVYSVNGVGQPARPPPCWTTRSTSWPRGAWWPRPRSCCSRPSTPWGSSMFRARATSSWWKRPCPTPSSTASSCGGASWCAP
jgi:Histidinol-phosphate/aromatic aminotransferase and cobyric acid decarboxylase